MESSRVIWTRARAHAVRGDTCGPLSVGGRGAGPKVPRPRRQTYPRAKHVDRARRSQKCRPWRGKIVDPRMTIDPTRSMAHRLRRRSRFRRRRPTSRTWSPARIGNVPERVNADRSRGQFVAARLGFGAGPNWLSRPAFRSRRGLGLEPISSSAGKTLERCRAGKKRRKPQPDPFYFVRSYHPAVTTVPCWPVRGGWGPTRPLGRVEAESGTRIVTASPAVSQNRSPAGGAPDSAPRTTMHANGWPGKEELSVRASLAGPRDQPAPGRSGDSAPTSTTAPSLSGGDAGENRPTRTRGTRPNSSSSRPRAPRRDAALEHAPVRRLREGGGPPPLAWAGNSEVEPPAIRDGASCANLLPAGVSCWPRQSVGRTAPRVPSTGGLSPLRTDHPAPG